MNLFMTAYYSTHLFWRTSRNLRHVQILVRMVDQLSSLKQDLDERLQDPSKDVISPRRLRRLQSRCPALIPGQAQVSSFNSICAVLYTPTVTGIGTAFGLELNEIRLIH